MDRYNFVFRAFPLRAFSLVAARVSLLPDGTRLFPQKVSMIELSGTRCRNFGSISVKVRRNTGTSRRACSRSLPRPVICSYKLTIRITSVSAITPPISCPIRWRPPVLADTPDRVKIGNNW